jgi:hypothetical protein
MSDQWSDHRSALQLSIPLLHTDTVTQVPRATDHEEENFARFFWKKNFREILEYRIRGSKLKLVPR